MRNADSRSKIAHIFLHKCKCFCVLENSPSATLADFLLMKEFGCSTFSIHCTENHTIVLKESKPRKFKTVRLDMTIRLPFRCVTVTCPALFFFSTRRDSKFVLVQNPTDYKGASLLLRCQPAAGICKHCIIFWDTFYLASYVVFLKQIICGPGHQENCGIICTLCCSHGF